PTIPAEASRSRWKTYGKSAPCAVSMPSRFISTILAACRFAENAYFHQAARSRLRVRKPKQIAREMFSYGRWLHPVGKERRIGEYRWFSLHQQRRAGSAKRRTC